MNSMISGFLWQFALWGGFYLLATIADRVMKRRIDRERKSE